MRPAWEIRLAFAEGVDAGPDHGWQALFGVVVALAYLAGVVAAPLARGVRAGGRRFTRRR